MTTIPFEHKMAAHCESGTVSALLRQAGMDVSEPMVFGVAGAVFFGYLPTRMLPFPTFVLRSKPGKIRTRIPKRLGVGFSTRKFRSAGRGMKELDALLEAGLPVAVQVDFFYMDYIPEYARAHFNAHYVIVVGKEGDKYVISDSYAPTLARLEAEMLERARFIGGHLAPKGTMFHVRHIPQKVDLAAAVRKGIAQAAFYMLRIPVPMLGVRGIRCFAGKLMNWPKYTRDVEHLSHEIMMIHIILEERGTGGGGFRFLYASFLQQAADVLGSDELLDASAQMMEDGDRWRDIALFAARIGKNRDLGPDRLKTLSEMIMERADVEDRLFRHLRKIVR